MIRSMTGFARYEGKHQWGTTVWELRSVNQRYLETSIRLPELFRQLEPLVREQLRTQLARGKIECSLRIEMIDESKVDTLVINKNLVLNILEITDWIKQQTLTQALNPIDILRWPGVISTESQNIEQYSEIILAELEQVIMQLVIAREEEGLKLKQLINDRLDIIAIEVSHVRQKMPEILQWQHAKLMNRFEELRIEIDHTRLEQELIILAQKIDVAEELDRLDVHIKETKSILEKGEAVGRRLDFLMQEFNREANTLSAKSINREVTNSAIDIKVLIEQMREQIQNIE